MKLTNAQVDAIANKVVSLKREQRDAQVKVVRNSKEVKDKVKKALLLITDMQKQLDVLEAQTDGIVKIDIKDTLRDWHSPLDKTLTTKFADVVIGEDKTPNQWDIKQTIVLASIDSTTLDELGKKLGVKL